MGPSQRWAYLIDNDTGSYDRLSCPSHLSLAIHPDNRATFHNINFEIICLSC